MRKSREKVVLLATGSEIIGRGIRSLYSVIEEMISSAKDEILIVTYTASGELEDLFGLLKEAALRGIKIRVLINRLEDQDYSLRKILNELSRVSKRVEIYSFRDKSGRNLHMKVFVVDRWRAVLGSANLTWKGLVDNLELGVYLEGGLAERISDLVGELIYASEPYSPSDRSKTALNT
jgi:cardiolipin synthase